MIEKTTDEKKTAFISIVIERQFDDFDDAMRADFLEDLSMVSGCPLSEIKNVRFSRGCVKFEGELDEAAVAYLVEIFKKCQIDGDHSIPESALRFFEFVEKHNISNISLGEERATLHIKADSETANNGKAIFVHGWRGNETSFGDIPRYISEELGITTKVYPYPSKTAEKMSLIFVAQNFDNWIRNNFDTKEKIALVGHSMGGLVIRRMISSQIIRDVPIDAHVRQITYVASPLAGAWQAKVLKYVPGASMWQAAEMSPDSPLMVQLHTEWNAWRKMRRSVVKSIRSIYGTGDKLVDPVTAIGDDPEAVPILKATHTDIVKPNNADDEIVRTIARFLTEAGLGRRSSKG